MDRESGRDRREHRYLTTGEKFVLFLNFVSDPVNSAVALLLLCGMLALFGLGIAFGSELPR